MEPRAQLLWEERSDALSIAALYRQVQAAITSSFPRGQLLWVRGEIQSISDRTGHCYIDLVDHDVPRARDTPVLKVNCWGRTWGPLKATLTGQGVVLEPGTVVTLRGRVEFYPPRGQVNFVATEVDVSALVGRLAARRAALLTALEAEGLLQRNRALAVPAVPLRVSLVASPGTEGYNDFLGQLRGSGLAFSVTVIRAHVQGAGAPSSVARALRVAGGSDADVTVVVRGGGSRGDLVAFDAEPVARAIASSPVPVWTGIGHTGDQSVADIVANRAFVTPTECGQELVRRVVDWWETLTGASDRVAALAAEVLRVASSRDASARARLSAATRHQLRRHEERLAGRAARLASQARHRLEDTAADAQRRSAVLGPRAVGVLEREEGRTATWRRLLAAYDVERQLERGYTITLGADGRVVRSATASAPGDVLWTRFADGRVRSTVEGVEAVMEEGGA